jgi:hypothetical protein
MLVNEVFQTHPCEQRNAKNKVKDAFVGDGEENEAWSEGEEDDEKSVEIVANWIQKVEEWNREGCNCWS